MHDLRWIRENPDAFDAGLEKRGAEPLAAAILACDKERRSLLQDLQDAQARRNAASKEIGKAKGAGDEAAAQALIDEVAELKARVQKGEDAERALNAKLHGMLAAIPNLPLDGVPVGADEDANEVVRTWGEKPAFDFAPKNISILVKVSVSWTSRPRPNCRARASWS